MGIYCDYSNTDFLHPPCTPVDQGQQGCAPLCTPPLNPPLMRGAKVLSLKVELFDIRFIDSFNFIPMKLANFPKTFGIEELAKATLLISSTRKKTRIMLVPFRLRPTTIRTA